MRSPLQFTFRTVSVRVFGLRRFNIFANNITLGWVETSLLVLSVAWVGVVVAICMRKQMLVVNALSLRVVVARSQTLKEIYANGAEAMARVRMLAEEWSALAVAQWKVVADLLQQGLSAMPEGALMAMAIGGAVVVVAVLDKTLPKNAALWVPSSLSIGCGFAIAVYYASSFFLGAVVYTAAERFNGKWTVRFAIVLATGIMVGE